VVNKLQEALLKNLNAQNTDLRKVLKKLNAVLMTEVMTLAVIVNLQALFR